MQDGVWEIFHYDHSNFYKPCICGHRVKRITYLYDRISKKIMFIGTTCLKKYGISNHLKNRILIQVLKENLLSLEIYSLEEKITTWIQTNYDILHNKIITSSLNTFDYYDIVAPFRRLLNDVCELATEYNFDLILLFKNIERDVESMNEYTKHYMIDEYDNSDVEGSISTIDDEIYDVHLIQSIPSEKPSDIEESISEEITEKILPIATADAFCTDPTCDPNFHCYCQLKFRLHQLKKGVIEHNNQIKIIHMKIEDIIAQSKTARKNFYNSKMYMYYASLP